MIVARKWDQSVRDTSHPYELIGAQFQTLFMNQARSRRLMLAQSELISAQPQLELLTHSSRYTLA